ncbi:hypothetical protein ACGF4C_04715 [Streptomyces sp. NPDC048197]|uniref:hypothetical protein n=1 Tax=Streptomyces sp. NPDC048197 TaxID=3365511 RepID=UPI0037129AB9
MMNALPRPLPPGSRWIPLALTVAVVSGCGLTGSPADFPTPSPPPSTTPAPPPRPLPDDSVPDLPCPAGTRLPDTVEVTWSVAAPVHRAAGPDGTSLLALRCRPLLLQA